MAPFGVSLPVIGLNNGFLGDFTRTGPRGIVARPVAATAALPIYFGDPVTILPDSTGGTLLSIADFIAQYGAGAFNPKLFAGIANRQVRTNLTFTALENLGAPQIGSYTANQMCEYGDDGSVNVSILHGTPVTQAPVYIRTLVNGSLAGTKVGYLEAAPDGTAAATAKGGNTGNGTSSVPTLGIYAQSGTYTVTFTGATTFAVYDPNNNFIGNGTTGTAFTSNGVNFTITAGGTAFVAGDGFTIAVAMKTVIIPNTLFRTGVLDANSVCEITMLVRVSA